ncbi:GrdX family protein [Brachyspira sp. SAP_772]|uniref:GrdX family protein n=1 Tax=Brachyspira sp. SAP_772 TaxID=2608385 RepID=UPI0012F506A7|nr:GrdX family protein [Brachyspira sp. SAP_772]
MLDVANLFIVTNNDKVLDKYPNYNIKYINSESMYEVFITARDLIHKGYKLLTHPMSSSLKANQTPYKSILMLKKNDGLIFEDLELIENAIENYNKFIKNRKLTDWPENIKNDFKTVDLSLIESCFSKTLPLN